MPIGNVIVLTPPQPGLPKSFGWAQAVEAPPAKVAKVQAQDVSSDSSSSDDLEASQCLPTRASTKSTSDVSMSLWKPVFVMIFCFNLISLGGLLCSVPWKGKVQEEEANVGAANVMHQIQRKLLIPAEVQIDKDGKVSATYSDIFKRELLDTLKNVTKGSRGQLAEHKDLFLHSGSSSRESEHSDEPNDHSTTSAPTAVDDAVIVHS